MRSRTNLLPFLALALLAHASAAFAQPLPLMRVHTLTTDLSSNPIASTEVGEQYRLLIYATDIRDPVVSAPGVFAAVANVQFDPSLSSIDVNQSVVFGSFFNFIQDATLAPGSALGYASTSSGMGPGNPAPQFLFSVVLTATAPGLQTFTPMFDNSDPDYENLMYLVDPPEPLPQQVEYVGSTLQIIPEPSTYALAAIAAAALLFARRRQS
jgi:hypothetical protein